MKAPKYRIFVGLSGGVDSAVTAYILKQQGHEVIGVFMKNWEDEEDNQGFCQSRKDWLDAVSVADVLGIDIEHIHFAKEYKERVFSYFLDSYKQGYTPNPDILCNSEIKFKAFLDYAMKQGAEKIATGHYARIEFHTEIKKYILRKGVDKNKDQSYFLYRLNQEQLEKSLFPIGHLKKTQVRQIADSMQLPNAKKKDSTGICFIGEQPFRHFLQRYLKTQSGEIQDENGRVLGKHMGLSFYTIGQRQGLGIGGIKNTQNRRGSENHQPWFVAKKDLENNILVVVQGHDHPKLLSQEVKATHSHWICNSNPRPGNYQAKTRYRQTDKLCSYTPKDGKNFSLSFYHPQWAVTPGQSVVVYKDDICLGGGIIDNSSLDLASHY
jgi:tRNA-specific 2-thiouridylase